MKHFKYLFLFLSLSIFSQEHIETSFIKKTPLEADTFVSVTPFEDTFYIFDNVLFKKEKHSKGIDVGYNNFQLGDISSVNTFNPLKINIFYKAFNTAVLLDNRMAEIQKIDFNNLKNSKNVSCISTGFDNSLWIFNQDTQQLELFDYKTNSSRFKSTPLASAILDITSNYNTCWLLTEKFIYVFNYVGNLVKKIKNQGFTSFKQSNDLLFLQKENQLFCLKKNTEKIIPIQLPNLLINAFFVTNETLYIYSNETLNEYHLKII